MKTGEVAKMMGLNPKTITNWTDQADLARFFSSGARMGGESSSQRDYTSDDILIINTIRLHKTRQNTWKDIAGILATGHREVEMPLSATLTKTISPADQLATIMAIRAERDTALAQLQDAAFEIERLRKEINEQRDVSSKEIIKLNREIARLELQLELLTKKLEEDQ
jgi:DNA-binding transcriptional MerR regulator